MESYFLKKFIQLLPKEIPFEYLKTFASEKLWKKNSKLAATLSLYNCRHFDEIDYLLRYNSYINYLPPIEHFIYFGINENNFFNYINHNISSKQIIISLTTYGDRIYFVHQTINSLLRQSIKNYIVILWLSEKEFYNKKIPYNLKKIKHKNFIIKYCEDLGSLKKVFFSLKLFPDHLIVTADDDIIYDVDWLEKLYSSYLSDKNVISCHRCHRIILDNNLRPIEYKRWSHNYIQHSISYLNFPTSGGGIILPPNCLNKEFFNINMYRKISYNRDDIWIWAMALLNKTKIKLINNPYNNIKKIVYNNKNYLFPQPLWKENIIGGKNDEAIKQILLHYKIENLLKA